MSDIIKLKRSGVAAAVPSSLELGEVALNYADGKLFYKNSVGSIVEFGGGDTLLRSLFVPPAPTGITATAGNAQVTVSWTAPTVLAQTPITDYVVQYSSNSGSSWTTFSDGTSATASATVTGLTNGTAYTFRVAAVNGVGQGAWSTASAAATPQAGDPLFGKVSLLLHMDGSGSTFVDSSKYGSTVTAYGNATQSAAQSKWGGKSAYLDGSGDYLAVPDRASLELGDQDFAIEMWIRTTQSTAYATLMSRASGAFFPGAWSLMLNDSTPGNIAVYAADYNRSAPLLRTTGVTVNDGEWHHVAWVRSGSSHSIYVDGTRRATQTGSFTISDSSESVVIGFDAAFAGRDYSGYIDDIRITRQSNRSYAGETITVPTTAFPEALPGADLNTTLLSRLNGDTTDVCGGTLAVSGTPSYAAGQFGQAMSGATLSTTVANGDESSWVVEGWVYVPSMPASGTVLWKIGSISIDQWGSAFGIGAALAITLDRFDAPIVSLVARGSVEGSVSSYVLTPSVYNVNTVPLATWSHVALSYSAGTLRYYVNGTLQRDRGSIYSLLSDGGGFAFGGSGFSVDEFRVSTLTDRGYTGSTITVPTAAFTDP